MSTFFENNLTLIYFFYGLAFFCMGLLVWIESGRASSFRLARAMGPLAGFGLVHGLHEWFEMFQRLGAAGAANIPAWLLLDEVRVAHLAFSFALLVIFGIRLIYLSRRDESRYEKLFAYLAAGGLLGIWGLSLLLTNWIYQPAPDEFIAAGDALSRYILGIPGAVLASWAIILEQRTFRRLEMPDTGRDLLRAALALFIYGVFGQAFPKASFLFPANVVNATLFAELFGIPVQLFRLMMAALMAIFIVRALRAFEIERQRNLAKANEARLVAQEEALAIQTQSKRETDKLNAELQTAVHDLTLLFDLSRTLAATLNRQELLNQAASQICRSLPYVQTSLIILRNRPDEPLRCQTHAGYDQLPYRGTPACHEGQVLVAQTLQSTQPAIYVDGHPVGMPLVQNGQAEAEVRLPMGNCLLGFPLGDINSVCGGLVLGLQPEMTLLRQRDLYLLEAIASQLTIAIENATRYGESQARETLRGELLHQVVSAQERERQRIARELHDGTGQALTALGLGFAAASENVQHDQALAAAQLSELKTMSTQALQDLRDLIRDLRPSLLDDLGLVPALQSQVQLFAERTGVQTDFVLNGRRQRVQPEIETIVFRIAQEALTNVAKHAHAQRVTVEIGFTDNLLDLAVRDDGWGFEPKTVFEAPDGSRQMWGLLGMQERVALVGGSCVVHSQPGRGTAVQVSIPITAV
ncbi:MAG: GAF domain-containing sensor histidine kinase [Ardenticatenaceae bacterium]|nr:GAF domain-containing sensor histidine kinase [Anaerolineales bacterium]MCB8972557.1 GAF domain-containing sensor histidine kinase [Ardenticatenaceae bacterium]